MPIYEYTCRATECGHEMSSLVKMGAPSPLCPKCLEAGRGDVPMTKKISRTGFKLEGGGWAKDGYG